MADAAATESYDYGRLESLLTALKSLDKTLPLLSSSCTPILHVEGIGDNTCIKTRILLLRNIAVDAREDFLKEMSVALTRYRAAVERELNRSLSMPRGPS